MICSQILPFAGKTTLAQMLWRDRDYGDVADLFDVDGEVMGLWANMESQVYAALKK